MVALVKKTFKTEKILARKVRSKQSVNNEFLTDIDILKTFMSNQRKNFFLDD